jgi:hypothetical protein
MSNGKSCRFAAARQFQNLGGGDHRRIRRELTPNLLATCVSRFTVDFRLWRGPSPC